MKKTLLFACMLPMAATVMADEDDKDKSWLHTAQVEMRADWQRDWIDGTRNADNSGFSGRYLQVILKGNISDKVSYAYRQRFSKSFEGSGLFNATDWVYLTYSPNEKWQFSGGKQTVAIGGYEWDYAPIDIYQYSEYCNNVLCYQIGASAIYILDKNNYLQAQVCQTPFRTNAPDMYGYSLKWEGDHGVYNNIWSVNMFEYLPGKFINYIALGNKLKFNGGHFLFDFTNRYSGGYGNGFLDDFTITSELHVQPVKELNIFAKYGYDGNKGNGGDYLVFDGTEQHHAGVGVEYFPLHGRKDLRLHANVFHTWGENTNPDGGVLQDKQTTFNIGMTLRADLLNIKLKK